MTVTLNDIQRAYQRIEGKNRENAVTQLAQTRRDRRSKALDQSRATAGDWKFQIQGRMFSD